MTEAAEFKGELVPSALLVLVKGVDRCPECCESSVTEDLSLSTLIRAKQLLCEHLYKRFPSFSAYAKTYCWLLYTMRVDLSLGTTVLVFGVESSDIEFSGIVDNTNSRAA
ncbi:hypothetical protein M8J77_001610 [Diaphorina citri]|nr:hypothetical protein M8J77_001610 [Diaphorina citri]